MRMQFTVETLDCFHSISFPNEWGGDLEFLSKILLLNVSIQLVSPTSGELHKNKAPTQTLKVSGFHSISFPNEWGAKNLLSIGVP